MHVKRSNPPTGFAAGTVSIPLATAVGVGLLIAAGMAYRVFASTEPGEMPPPVPLAAVPLQIGDWTGEEADLDPSIVNYMENTFADDYIYRNYVNGIEQLAAAAYVVYCSNQPARILGHKPEVCYRGTGWTKDSTTESEFTTLSGRTIPCLIHSFHKSIPSYQQTHVVNFYVHNGKIQRYEPRFSLPERLRNRKPDVYVLQVQISSASEHAAQALAAQITDLVLRSCPGLTEN